MMRDELRFGLLGPPVLYDADGEFRPIGSAKMRALLAALLQEPGRVVPVDVLKDALWGGAPPASAQASLHNHVTRLRRLLDDPERLRAVPPGYVLRVGEGELDVRVFAHHATAARVAHAGRDWERALREATAALALWRGTPLSGLPPETGGHAFVQRLEEARLLVLEWRYEAELMLASTVARRDRLAPELAALTAEYPLREAFHRLLMLVLHRTGRQAEALAVHRDLRARLLEELGIEYAGVAARSLEAILEPGLDREDRSRPTAAQPHAHAADVVATPPFRSAKEAFAWGDLELENLVALVERHAATSPYVPVLVRHATPNPARRSSKALNSPASWAIRTRRPSPTATSATCTSTRIPGPPSTTTSAASRSASRSTTSSSATPRTATSATPTSPSANRPRPYRTSRRACASLAPTATGTASRRPGSASCGRCAGWASGSAPRANATCCCAGPTAGPTVTPEDSPATSEGCS
ncbi:hypothetical protein B1C81_28985 [Streptomyces sp. HG99]|nr:hypothetical protein B1C81_28985 [Streptomyces sp. HG99]